MRSNTPRYATRFNAYLTAPAGDRAATIADAIARAASVDGLDAADLNYPDHFADCDPSTMKSVLDTHGLALNGLAMRYYSQPGFKIGAFTNPDRQVRQAAIDLTKNGIDAVAAMGGRLMTLWLGQDGFDYAFQVDYRRMWDDTIEALTTVADHNRDVDIAIEYKPDEPRAFALMPDVATTLLAVKEVSRANIGVTLDFAHVLYAGEMPAHSVSLVARHARLLGVHLNDGYGKRDDGLMVGTVHPVQTVELLVALARTGYDGVLYFDTFPDHGGLDPVEETRTNIRMVETLRAVAVGLAEDEGLAAAIAKQDATASMRIVADALYADRRG